MVEKVVIRDNRKSPVRYIGDMKAFRNGKEYVFKPGVNIIVGENGCGKTTLMKLIRAYLLVDSRECGAGVFNNNINSLHKDIIDKGLLDGVDVYADYRRNTFRLCHRDEKTDDDIADTGAHFFEHFDQLHSSTGESVVIAMNTLFESMYGKDARLTFDYSAFFGNYPEYGEYVKTHAIKGDEWTILMDEPDRNLDIEKIGQIRGILSYHKEHTQIIAVIHNPLLICALSRLDDVNIIEMTRGYVRKVRKIVKELYEGGNDGKH